MRGGGGDGGIEHGDLLVEFAEAVVDRDDHRLDRARTALLAAVGPTGFADAAGTAASFVAVVRVADATGIPFEDQKHEATRALRAELGIDAFDAA